MGRSYWLRIIQDETVTIILLRSLYSLVISLLYCVFLADTAFKAWFQDLYWKCLVRCPRGYTISSKKKDYKRDMYLTLPQVRANPGSHGQT